MLWCFSTAINKPAPINLCRHKERHNSAPVSSVVLVRLECAAAVGKGGGKGGGKDAGRGGGKANVGTDCVPLDCAVVSSSAATNACVVCTE